MRNEDREKFKNLAQKRVNRAIKDLSLIGNLANKSNYSYSQKDADNIVEALKTAVNDVKNKFSGRGDEREPFTLD